MTALDEGNTIKTLISGLMGLLLATVGMDPIYGFPRFTWGNSTLLSGIEMIPVMIGMFAVTKVLNETVERSKLQNIDEAKRDKIRDGIVKPKELWAMKGTIVRSGILGTIVGILPGAGATIASFLSYSTEVKLSKNPGNYGHGEPRGIAAAETANNAATAVQWYLYYPSAFRGNAAAIMMSAIIMKGVQMGPMLLQRQPEYMGSVFVSMMFTNIVMVFVSFAVAKVFGKILSIPYSILGTLILLLATIGSYALQNNTGNVILMVIAGIFGYAYSNLASTFLH